MDKFKQSSASSSRSHQLNMEDINFKNHQFNQVRLPFTQEQRYFQFRQMMWNYGRHVISEDDWKLSARPKKQILGFGLFWGAIAAALRYQYTANPEPLFKRFFLTPWAVLYFASPLVAAFWYQRSQSKIYHQIYERTVGHLSDVELLELDMKFNPNKKLVYQQIID